MAAFDAPRSRAGPATRRSECRARTPSSIAFIPVDSASYAAYWLANSVSPPYAGTSTPYRSEPIGGAATCGVSECQSSPMILVSPGLRTMSITAGSDFDPWMLGCRNSVPKRDANALWRATSSACSRKKMTPCASSAPRIAGNGRVVEIAREIYAQHLGAECAGDGLDAQRARHFG